MGIHGLMQMPPKPPISCPIRQQALQTPDQPALMTPDRSFTYAMLDEAVSAAEARMTVIEINPGDRVALYAPTDFRYPILLWALLRRGAVACLLNTRTPAQTLGSLLNQMACRTLILSPSTSPPNPTNIRVFRPGYFFDAASSITPETTSPPLLNLDAPATLLFTSGSSGAAKAVLHSFRNHYFSAVGAQANMPVTMQTRWLLVLPLYHVGGLAVLFRCFLHGGTVVLPADPRRIGEAVQHYRTTHVSLVATQLQRLLSASPAPNLDTLTAILLGGSAIPPSLLAAAHARRLPVHASYGSSEMASQITTTPPRADLETLQTSGLLLPHRQLRIAADGQIWVRGKTRFLGYVKENELEQPFDRSGWYATGDRGRLDEAGRLRVLGRIDNMFISGGENIHPEEIEKALCSLPEVTDAVVVPIPDATFGFQPVAFVKSPDQALHAKVWMKHLEAMLPRFKIPRYFYPWPADADQGLKVDRAALQARALESTTT